MPKTVDRTQRRDAIADALFEVLREGGLSRVTLGSVADRAGLAIGSVRHFLGTREEMIGFAFDTVSNRFQSRILARAEALRAALDGGQLDAEARLQATAGLLCELLPLDATRRDEAVVWIEFETAARTDPQLAEISARAAAHTTRLIQTVLQAAQERGAVSPHLDLDVEIPRLGALIDGLTIRASLHPDLLTPETAREAVIVHLRQLRRPTDDEDPRDERDRFDLPDPHRATNR